MQSFGLPVMSTWAKCLFTLNNSVTVTVTLMGRIDGQNGLHTYFSRQRNVCDEIIWCERALRFVHTERRQRQRKITTWMGCVESNGGCSHWGAATAMAKVTSMATSWNGLDTHLWWQRQRQRQIGGGVNIYMYIAVAVAFAIDAPQCEHSRRKIIFPLPLPPPVWTKL